MPRASGIWIIKGSYGNPDVIHGAFTVKGECAKWLKRVADPENYLVERYQDGRPGLPTRVPMHELLAIETR